MKTARQPYQRTLPGAGPGGVVWYERDDWGLSSDGYESTCVSAENPVRASTTCDEMWGGWELLTNDQCVVNLIPSELRYRSLPPPSWQPARTKKGNMTNSTPTTQSATAPPTPLCQLSGAAGQMSSLSLAKTNSADGKLCVGGEADPLMEDDQFGVLQMEP